MVLVVLIAWAIGVAAGYELNSLIAERRRADR